MVISVAATCSSSLSSLIVSKGILRFGSGDSESGFFFVCSTRIRFDPTRGPNTGASFFFFWKFRFLGTSSGLVLSSEVCLLGSSVGFVAAWLLRFLLQDLSDSFSELLVSSGVSFITRDQKTADWEARLFRRAWSFLGAEPSLETEEGFIFGVSLNLLAARLGRKGLRVPSGRTLYFPMLVLNQLMSCRCRRLAGSVPKVRQNVSGAKHMRREVCF